MNIKLTQQEAQALLQLLDLAVKAGGLNVAATAVVFAEKIRDATAEAQLTKE